MLIHNADITGSLTINGIPYNTGSFSGSFTGIVAGTTATASYVEYNNVANKPALVSGSSQITYSGLTGIPSGIVSGSSQVTYSGLTGIPSGIVSGSAQVAGFGIFATTGSNQFNGNQAITGSLTTTGTIVAQTLNVQQVTSSIVYSSGSNIFGNSLANTQQFTGSVGVTGSLTVAGAGTFTGALNGSSAVFSGNVGIGNSSFDYPLQVLNTIGLRANSTSFQAIKGTYWGYSTSYPVVMLGNSNTSSFTTVSIGYDPSANANGAFSGDGREVLFRRGAQFVTPNAANTAFNLTNLVLLDGNVGIGTNGPSERLDILGPDGSGAAVRWRMDGGRKSGYLYSDSAGVGIYDTNLNDAGIYLAQNTQIDFRVNGSQRMIITSGGNVGIGTTSIAASSGYKMLRINGATTGAEIELAGNEVSYGYMYASAGIFVIDALASQPIRFRTGAQNRMDITSAGNVGIGTTSPSAAAGLAFVLNSGANQGRICIKTSSTGDGSGAGLQIGMAGLAAFIEQRENADLTFATNATERMRITSGGNVGIGTTPSTKFHVVGESRFGTATNYVSTAADGSGVYFENTGTTTLTRQIRFQGINDAGNAYSQFFINHGAGNFQFWVNDQERMRITSTGVRVGASFFTYPVSIEAQSGGGQLALTRSGAYTEFYMGGSTEAGTQLYVRSGGSGGVRLDTGATSWASASDIRLKDIEKPIENAVESLSTLQTVYYSWKNSDNKSLHLGLIAQEVEAVFPEIVSESSIDEMKGVNYTELIPVLVKAIQEQQSQIEILKAEIQTLKQ